MKKVEGNLLSEGLKIAIVLSRFNSFYSERLLEGALDAIRRTGGAEKNVTVYKVPGSFEIPSTIKKIAETKKFDGILALGVIIRGETPHFEYVAQETSKGIAELSIRLDIPIGYGIVTADELDQAADRSGAKMGNKGFSSAMALIEMINLFRQIGENNR